MSPEAIAERFLAYMEVEKTASAHTLAAYRRTLQQFRDWMGPRFVSWHDCSSESFRG